MVVVAPDVVVASQVYRITGHNAHELSTQAQNTDANPDPSSLNPTGWGTENTLWLAVANRCDDSSAITAYPTNYTNGTDTIADGGANKSAGVESARRELNAASEDPGTFTIDESEAWIAHTIGIEPS